jgi:hypothetical protein
MRALARECHHSTLPPGTQAYLTNLVEAEDLLEGALASYYSKPPQGAPLRRGLWYLQENARGLLRRWRRKVAFWA